MFQTTNQMRFYPSGFPFRSSSQPPVEEVFHNLHQAMNWAPWLGRPRREFAMWAMHGHAPQMVLGYSMLKWDIKQIRVQHLFSLADIYWPIRAISSSFTIRWVNPPCHLNIQNKILCRLNSRRGPCYHIISGKWDRIDPVVFSCYSCSSSSWQFFFAPRESLPSHGATPNHPSHLTVFAVLVLKQPWQLEDPPF